MSDRVVGEFLRNSDLEPRLVPRKNSRKFFGKLFGKFPENYYLCYAKEKDRNMFDVTKHRIEKTVTVKEPLYGTVRVVDIITDDIVIGDTPVVVFFNHDTRRYGACDLMTFLYGAIIQQESDTDKRITKAERDRIYKMNGFADGYPYPLK